MKTDVEYILSVWSTFYDDLYAQFVWLTESIILLFLSYRTKLF